MRWNLPALVDPLEVDRLVRDLALDRTCAELLVRRGYAEPATAERFLHSQLADLPDPFTMLGMTAAAARLAKAIRGHERIILYGDYDVDGVSSTALMTGVLRELGATSELYIPHRLEEGYGLNMEAVTLLAAKGSGLLITLDCGVTAVAEVAHAVRSGLEVVIVDHHTTPAELPGAHAILNPHQPGCAYPTKHLCAAGVAFCLLMATRRVLRDAGFFATRPEPNLKSWLDLVALATVADVVPLVGANRILVKHGLTVLSEAGRPGVRALREVAEIKPDARITAGLVGFRLGPRINAAGRLGAATAAVELLTTADASRARELAQALDAQNRERQAIERKMTQEAIVLAEVQVERGLRGLVVSSEGWHAGVVGIVAARVMERFHRPTIAIALNDGVGKGSGRSVEGFHLHEALTACSAPLARFGGHKHAAGLTVDQARLPEFEELFFRHAAEQLSPEDLQPRLRLDAPLELGRVSLDLIHQVEALGPFGAGNPEPTFFGRGIPGGVRTLDNKGAGDPHLKLTLRQSDADRPVKAIAFGLGGLAELCQQPVMAAFQLQVDDFGGSSQPQLKVKHLKAVDDSAVG